MPTIGSERQPNAGWPRPTVEDSAVPSRTRYINVLQICGAFAIIAFHEGASWAAGGWMAVELFFVLAGFNMANALGRPGSVLDFGRTRIRRMYPEVGVVWLVVALMAMSGASTQGATWFLATGPAFLHNLTVLFFDYQLPLDFAFGPLWFVGALLQLQLMIWVFRYALARSRTSSVVVVVVALGVAFRLLGAWLLGGNGGELDARSADALYCLPLTHVEAITLGVLLARGSLARLGRCLPALLALIVVAGSISARLSTLDERFWSLGFELPLRTNYLHVWGYALLAFGAAALCSPHNAVALRLDAIQRVPSWLDATLATMSALTFSAYAFHGVLIALGLDLREWINPGLPGHGTLLFAVVAAEAFLFAWVFASARTRLLRLHDILLNDRAQPTSERPRRTEPVSDVRSPRC